MSVMAKIRNTENSCNTLYRRGKLTADAGGKAKSTNLLPCSCACPRRIRVARTTLEAGPIVCGICDEEFTAELQPET